MDACLNSRYPQQLSRMEKFLLSCALFSYYLGDIAIVPWSVSLFSLLLIRSQALVTLFLYISPLVLMLVARATVMGGDWVESIKDLRFYWGFLPFLVYFRSIINFTPNGREVLFNYFKKFFFYALIFLVLEFISANFLHIEWPNRFVNPTDAFEMNVSRAFGFGANSTVTAVLFLALSSVIYRGFFQDLFVIVFATSGTGAVALLIKAILRSKLHIKLLFLFSFLSLFIFISQSDLAKNYTDLQKLGTTYFEFILNYKLDQIRDSNFGSLSIPDLLIGRDMTQVQLRTGDFQMLDFLLATGMLGAVYFISLVISNLKKQNYIPIIICFIGSFHYQIFFSMPGTLLFAWFLAYDGSSVNRSEVLSLMSTEV